MKIAELWDTEINSCLPIGVLTTVSRWVPFLKKEWGSRACEDQAIHCQQIRDQVTCLPGESGFTTGCMASALRSPTSSHASLQ